MLIRFSPRQIEAFLAIADLESFSRAAARLNLSPSAVSGLIAELEAVIGFVLFERTTRKVTLSGAGRQFLPSAQSAMRQLQLTTAAANDIARRRVGLVRVAAPLVVASVIVPPVLAEFSKLYPNVSVRLADTPVDRLGPSLAEGEVDLAVGADRAPPAGVVSERLFPSPWVLWCSPESQFAKRRFVRWGDLIGVELCTAGRDHEQSVAQMTLDQPADKRVTPTQIVDNMSTALGLAAANLAVTASPAYVRPLAEKFGLQMKRIIDPEVMRHLTIFKPERRAMSPATEALAGFLSERLRDAGPPMVGKRKRSAAT